MQLCGALFEMNRRLRRVATFRSKRLKFVQNRQGASAPLGRRITVRKVVSFCLTVASPIRHKRHSARRGSQRDAAEESEERGS
jgi:hypothetical protein